MTVVVAVWAVAIGLNPFRMLDKERIMHLALKLRVSRNFGNDVARRGPAELVSAYGIHTSISRICRRTFLRNLTKQPFDKADLMDKKHTKGNTERAGGSPDVAVK